MALHFQVYADFKYTKGKRSLVGTALYSTRAACSDVPFYSNQSGILTISRIFPTLKEAQSFIAYLHGVYKYPATLPVLDSEQPDLFMEVSK